MKEWHTKSVIHGFYKKDGWGENSWSRKTIKGDGDQIQVQVFILVPSSSFSKQKLIWQPISISKPKYAYTNKALKLPNALNISIITKPLIFGTLEFKLPLTQFKIPKIYIKCTTQVSVKRGDITPNKDFQA